MYVVEWCESEKTGYGSSVGTSRLRSRSFGSAQQAAEFAANLTSDVWHDRSCVTVKRC